LLKRFDLSLKLDKVMITVSILKKIGQIAGSGYNARIQNICICYIPFRNYTREAIAIEKE